MNEISPAIASTLADRIYAVLNPMLVDIFLKLPYFMIANKSDTSPNTYIIAEVNLSSLTK